MADIQLTAQQRAAVENRGGSLLVSAAAGSGKTKVLVERVFAYLTEEHCHIDDFLIITFTRGRCRRTADKACRRAGEAGGTGSGERHLRRRCSGCIRRTSRRWTASAQGCCGSTSISCRRWRAE